MIASVKIPKTTRFYFVASRDNQSDPVRPRHFEVGLPLSRFSRALELDRSSVSPTSLFEVGLHLLADACGTEGGQSDLSYIFSLWLKKYIYRVYSYQNRFKAIRCNNVGLTPSLSLVLCGLPPVQPKSAEVGLRFSSPLPKPSTLEFKRLAESSPFCPSKQSHAALDARSTHTVTKCTNTPIHLAIASTAP